MGKLLDVQQENLARLESLEKIVGACLVPMIKGWAALGEILKDRLWQAAGFKKEKDYLEKRWGELSRSGFFHNKRIAYVAAAIGADNLPDGTRPAHLACLVNFEPAVQQEIWERAKATAPGGEAGMTAAHVEKTARLVQDERRAAIKEQAQAEKSRAAAVVEEDDEDEDEYEEDEGEEADDSEEAEDSSSSSSSNSKSSNTPAPAKPAPRPSPVKRAMAHPIIDGDRVGKLEKQAERTVRKLERIALALNVTPQDLLERYGSDAA